VTKLFKKSRNISLIKGEIYIGLLMFWSDAILIVFNFNSSITKKDQNNKRKKKKKISDEM